MIPTLAEIKKCIQGSEYSVLNRSFQPRLLTELAFKALIQNTPAKLVNLPSHVTLKLAYQPINQLKQEVESIFPLFTHIRYWTSISNKRHRLISTIIWKISLIENCLCSVNCVLRHLQQTHDDFTRKKVVGCAQIHTIRSCLQTFLDVRKTLVMIVSELQSPMQFSFENSLMEDLEIGEDRGNPYNRFLAMN